MDAAGWDERFTAEAHPWGLEPNRFVREHCERLPVGDALDLACGDGRHALWLGRLGWRVLGVDFSGVALEQARHQTAQRDSYQALRLSWRLADVTTLQLKPESFDLVLASDLPLASAQRDDLLVRAAQALRPRGHLVVVSSRSLPAGDAQQSTSEPSEGDDDPSEIAEVLTERGGLVVEVARLATRASADGPTNDCVVRARRAPLGVTA